MIDKSEQAPGWKPDFLAYSVTPAWPEWHIQATISHSSTSISEVPRNFVLMMRNCKLVFNSMHISFTCHITLPSLKPSFARPLEKAVQKALLGLQLHCAETQSF